MARARTWTEHSDHIDAREVLTRRAGAEACRQVGAHARPVTEVAREFSVCWWTVMNAVLDTAPHWSTTLTGSGGCGSWASTRPGSLPHPRSPHPLRHRAGRLGAACPDRHGRRQRCG